MICGFIGNPDRRGKEKKLEEMYERRRFERRKWPGWNNFFVSVPPEVAPIAKPIGISVQDVSYINTHKHTQTYPQTATKEDRY